MSTERTALLDDIDNATRTLHDMHAQIQQTRMYSLGYCMCMGNVQWLNYAQWRVECRKHNAPSSIHRRHTDPTSVCHSIYHDIHHCINQ